MSLSCWGGVLPRSGGGWEWRETGQVWPIFFDVLFLTSVDLFSRPDHLNGHIKQVHTSERPHKCQVGTGPGYSWVEECCCPPSLGLSTALHTPHSCRPCPASGLLCSILSLLCFPRATSLFFWSLVSSLHRLCLHSVAYLSCPGICGLLGWWATLHKCCSNGSDTLLDLAADSQ